MSAKVWVLGDAVVDLLPESDGRLLPCPGGAPANVAVGIARLGGTSGFIGRVGDDPFGALMQRTLLTEGVDITYLKQDEWHRTSTVLVDLNDQGERSFTFMVRPSADLFLETTDLPCWRHGEWLHLCSIALSAEPSRTSAFTAMTAIRHAGGFVSFDPNIREDLWQDEHLLRLCLRQALQLADVVKLSEEEWRLISGKTQNDRDICALAKEYEIAMLLVTKGAEGVVVCYRGQVHHFAGMSVNCVDSTGAGDAFVAGLLTGLSSTGLSTDEREMRRIIDRQVIMALNIPFRNAYYRFASSYSFLFFISWSLWWSLYAIWLKGHLGLTGTELGTLYSVNQFTSILFMMFYGIVQDKLGLKKPLIWCMSFILVLTGPFMIYVYEPLLQSNFSVGLILGALFFGLGYLAGCGLLDSFTEKMARNFHFEYGTARAWGSFGYAIGAFFAGIFFSISPHINFWLVSLFGAVFMMINMRFKDKGHQCVAADAGGVKKEDFIAVFKDRNFWVFVIFIVGTWSFYNIFDQQLFPVFYAGLFESHDVGTRLYGYLNSFQVVLEALCMAIIPFFVNRVGPKNALLIGVVIMALRILSCALFVNPWIISLVKLLHAIEVPLCVISVFKYSVANFDKRLSSTIFLIGFQIASSLGIVLLSTPTGILFDHAGYQTVFFAISGIVCLMLLFGIFFLSKKREQIVMETPVPSAI